VGIAALAVAAGAWPSSASAHPHVFIDCGVGLLFSGDRIDGIRLSWTFDDLFSGFILQEFDRDRNGTLSPAEVRQIEAKHLAEFRRVRFFTMVSLNGKEIDPGPARDFTATVVKGIVTYQFTLSLVAPLASTTTIEVVPDDPSYYIAYMATAASPQTQTIGPFTVECRIAHDKTGVTPDAIRCGVRRR
jgi:tRNA threonylcarbamoyladenosine biosynthesis protein TsaE